MKTTDVKRIDITGKLTIRTIALMRDLLQNTLAEGHALEIELPDDEEIDTAGLQALLAAQKGLDEEHRCRISIVTSSGSNDTLRRAGLEVTEHQMRPINA